MLTIRLIIGNGTSYRESEFGTEFDQSPILLHIAGVQKRYKFVETSVYGVISSYRYI